MGDYTRDNHLIGSTDFAEHFVYQTKWLKFGLQSLLLQDNYVIPKIYDKYDALFWWDYTCEHVAGDIFGKKDNNYYPYLTWAQGHFMGNDEQTLPRNAVYPLTWETNASQADYEGIRILSKGLADSKTAAPHTWHSAEMFLYLLEKDDNF